MTIHTVTHTARKASLTAERGCVGMVVWPE